ncbi:hypothetical protein HRbin12_00851 [bacterium HR12]|nr:hypothetical protein HRbin12_00851 [bacterium HR12]
MSLPSPHRSSRGRAVLAGLLAGIVAGSLAGAIARSPAPSPETRARVLHAAPVLAEPGAPVVLRFATACDPSGTPACELRSAELHVRADGVWRTLPGTVEAGEAAFIVPGHLVADDGFAYYAELVPERGAPLTYPPSGAAHPIAVAGTAGFARIRLPSDLSLEDVREADGLALFLPWGSGRGEAGLADAHPGEEALGPSSFAVGPDGALYVADWVNGRIQVFSGAGYRELPTPARTTLDLAVDEAGRIGLVGLGMGAKAYLLDPDGRRLGAFPVALGAPTRIAAAADGMRVGIGPGQWVPVGRPGGPALSPAEQDAGRSSSIDQAASQDLAEDRFAAAWPTARGTTGVVVALPEGIRVGIEYFVRPLPDGGALVARGLWNDAAMAVGVFRFSADGELLGLSLLPEPSTRMDARSSTVRFRPPNEVLVARDRADGIAVERFEVMP